MTCDVCGKEIPRGQRYQGNKYKSLHFCCEDCFKRYTKLKTKPKPIINYKPEKGTDRRKFTDFIQEWTDDKANWPYLMKQAKDIQEEYDLDWHTMYLVCKYAKNYENSNTDYFTWSFKQDGASAITRLLFEEATDINFFVGCAINPAHQGEDVKINFAFKMQLIEELSKCLKQMGKNIKVSYF